MNLNSSSIYSRRTLFLNYAASLWHAIQREPWAAVGAIGRHTATADYNWQEPAKSSCSLDNFFGTAMFELPPLIEPLFRAAGWQGPKSHAQPSETPATAYAIASQIVDEFGGLTVGTCGPGTEMATSDVCFYERLRSDNSDLFKAWAEKVGEVAAFASAHHDHMILSVGANGIFYVFTDPDHQLYEGPHDFGELMRRLLWGYSYGPTIPKGK